MVQIYTYVHSGEGEGLLHHQGFNLTRNHYANLQEMDGRKQYGYVMAYQFDDS